MEQPCKRFPGVYATKSNKWKANKQYNGTKIHLGTFDSKNEAIQALIKFCSKNGIGLPKLSRRPDDIYRYDSEDNLLEVLCRQCDEWLSVNDFPNVWKGKSKHKRRTICRSCLSENHVLKTYNMTHDEYKRKSELQEGKCYICKKNPIECVDHCHETMHRRHLLCKLCNSVLGMINEDPKIAKRFVDYSKYCQALKSTQDV